MELDPKASRAQHEAAIEQFVIEADPELGAILAPYLRFEHLETATDATRRRVRLEVGQKVRAALDILSAD